MSWSAKRLWVALSSALLLFACEDPDEIGLSLQNQSNRVGFFFTDTLSIRTSTVLLDSVISASLGTNPASNNGYPRVLLVGNYRDPVFGAISAKSFFTVGQFTNFNPGENPEADSLVLLLSYIPNYHYGDTTQAQTLAVHRLADTLDLNRTYYTFEEAGYDNRVLGSKQFLPTPRKRDTLRIAFDPSVAKQLGNEILNLPTLSNEAGAFRKFFRGLALTTNQSGNAVLGFSLGSTLRLYYHNRATPGEQLAYNFEVTAAPLFNQVKADRRGSLLGVLTPNTSLPSDQTSGQAFIQSALGVATKIEFPTLGEFGRAGRVGINRAELVVETQSNSGSQNLAPPFQVYLAESTTTNRVATDASGPVYVPAEEGAGAFNSQIPQIASFSSGVYTFNFTSYFQALLAGAGSTELNPGSGKKPNNGLLLTSATNPVSGGVMISYDNGLITGAALAGNGNVKLKLYYTAL
ncbi:MAG: DUF4270 family protein [Ferruginibacter sp.]|nr:DUF4270 family protein [Cytophagales bacterium]